MKAQKTTHNPSTAEAAHVKALLEPYFPINLI
jgi:hypothetical protein